MFTGEFVLGGHRKKSRECVAFFEKDVKETLSYFFHSGKREGFDQGRNEKDASLGGKRQSMGTRSGDAGRSVAQSERGGPLGPREQIFQGFCLGPRNG